jgi:hypothetical protein
MEDEGARTRGRRRFDDADDERDDDRAASRSRAGGDARVEVATPGGRREEDLGRNGEENDGGEEREARVKRGASRDACCCSNTDR